MIVVAGLILASWGGPSPASIGIVADACPQVDVEQVAWIVALETQRPASVLSASSARPPRVVELRCSTTRVQLQVTDTTVERRMDRSFELAAPEIRARHVALEIAESVEALESIAPDPRPPPPADEGREPTPTPELSRWWMGAMLGAAVGGRPAHASGGGGLFAFVRPRRWVTTGVEVQARGGARRLDVGRVDVATVDASAIVAFGHAGRWGSVDAGPGVRVGGAWLRGRPTPDGIHGRGMAGATWGPVAAMRVGLSVRPRLRLRLGLTAGWTARGVAGRDPTRVVFSTAGPWAELDLGLGVIF